MMDEKQITCVYEFQDQRGKRYSHGRCSYQICTIRLGRNLVYDWTVHGQRAPEDKIELVHFKMSLEGLFVFFTLLKTKVQTGIWRT